MAFSFLLSAWPTRWFFSGAGILQILILFGAARGCRILPSIHLYPLLVTLNLIYAVAATSWLLYWVFALLCYPIIFVTCLYQFNAAGYIVRRNLRGFLRQLHFIDDKIAFFDIPALEIDTEVDGLMVLRGITFSLSTLTMVVHGVEVGIKLSDDLELAISTDEVRVSLFRKIEVGDCFANIKGGEFEMTSGKLGETTKDEDGDATSMNDSPVLKVASEKRDNGKAGDAKMRDVMTDGHAPKDTLAKDGWNSVTDIVVDNDEAKERYLRTLRSIKESSLIQQSKKTVEKIFQERETTRQDFQKKHEKGLRAGICSNLHRKPSVPHPPSKSIRVTTLQNLSPPYIRKFLHRLPFLLRLLLNIISYFHPVTIASITATGSGRWLSTILEDKIFQFYGEQNSEIRRLEKAILAWLAEVNFAVEICNITGLAQIPINPTNEIMTQLVFEEVLAYRALSEQVDIQQVMSLGGADATFKIPSFLLPHHEHLLPPIPSQTDKEKIKLEVEEADSKIEMLKAKHELDQVVKDETNVKLSAHIHLPAVFSQELLNFITALIKVTKIAEIEAESETLENAHGFNEIRKAVNKHIKDDFKKAVVSGVVSEKWIAKMVKKVTIKMERLRGDVGYVGEIPVKLGPYREGGNGERKKILL